MMKKIFSLCSATVLFYACGNTDNTSATPGSSVAIPAPATINYNIVKIYPHDTSSFTQGLVWYNNALYEGTGLHGQSRLMNIDMVTGRPLKAIDLADQYFGEGITIFNNKIYQLTWKEHKVFVYDLANFKKIEEFNWTYEGWGLTHNGKQLIVSTGDSNLYFVNPETFAIERTLGVSDNNGYVSDINELEYLNGSIYANVLNSDYILKISPETGNVEGRMDFSNLLQKTNQPTHSNIDVLNGIAYDAGKNSFYITGKKWPALYEVKLN